MFISTQNVVENIDKKHFRIRRENPVLIQLTGYLNFN